MMKFVRGVEEAVRKAGVPINHPREQTFHGTMARVRYTYPTDEVIQKLRDMKFWYGTIRFDWFFLEDHIFRARDRL